MGWSRYQEVCCSWDQNSIKSLLAVRFWEMHGTLLFYSVTLGQIGNHLVNRHAVYINIFLVRMLSLAEILQVFRSICSSNLQVQIDRRCRQSHVGATCYVVLKILVFHKHLHRKLELQTLVSKSAVGIYIYIKSRIRTNST